MVQPIQIPEVLNDNNHLDHPDHLKLVRLGISHLCHLLKAVGHNLNPFQGTQVGHQEEDLIVHRLIQITHRGRGPPQGLHNRRSRLRRPNQVSTPIRDSLDRDPNNPRPIAGRLAKVHQSVARLQTRPRRPTTPRQVVVFNNSSKW